MSKNSGELADATAVMCCMIPWGRQGEAQAIFEASADPVGLGMRVARLFAAHLMTGCHQSDEYVSTLAGQAAGEMFRSLPLSEEGGQP